MKTDPLGPAHLLFGFFFKLAALGVVLALGIEYLSPWQPKRQLDPLVNCTTVMCPGGPVDPSRPPGTVYKPSNHIPEALLELIKALNISADKAHWIIEYARPPGIMTVEWKVKED